MSMIKTPDGIKLTEKTLKAMRGDFHEKVWASVTYRDNVWAPRWDDAIKRYESWESDNETVEEGKSRYKTTKPFSSVEHWEARIFLSFFSQYPFAGVLPTKEEETETAPVYQQLIDKQFTRTKASMAISRSLKMACKIGLGISKIVPDFAIRDISGKPTKVFLNPRFLYIDPWMFGIDPELQNGDPDTASFMYDEDVVNFDELVYLYDIGEYPLFDPRELKDNDQFTDQLTPITNRLSRSTTRRVFDINPLANRPKKVRKFIRHEIWTTYDIDGDGVEEDVVETWIAGKHLMRVILNPLGTMRRGGYPYKFIRVIQVEDDFPGLGVILPATNDFEELQTHHRQVQDNINIVINAQTIVRKGAGVDIKSLLNSRAGGVIETLDMNAVRRHDTGDIAPLAVGREGYIEKNVSEVTSVWPTMQGAPGPRRETATTDRGRDASGNLRIQMDMLKINEDFIIPSLKIWARYNRKYLKHDEFVLITGQKGEKSWQKINGSMIGDYDYEPYGPANDPIYSKPVRQQTLINLRKIWQNAPHVNFYALDKQIAIAFNLTNVDELLTVPEAKILDFIKSMVGQGFEPEQIIERLIIQLMQIVPKHELQRLNMPTFMQDVDKEPRYRENEFDENRREKPIQTEENITESVARSTSVGGSNNGRP